VTRAEEVGSTRVGDTRADAAFLTVRFRVRVQLLGFLSPGNPASEPASPEAGFLIAGQTRPVYPPGGGQRGDPSLPRTEAPRADLTPRNA